MFTLTSMIICGIVAIFAGGVIGFIACSITASGRISDLQEQYTKEISGKNGLLETYDKQIKKANGRNAELQNEKRNLNRLNGELNEEVEKIHKEKLQLRDRLEGKVKPVQIKTKKGMVWIDEHTGQRIKAPKG